MMTILMLTELSYEIASLPHTAPGFSGELTGRNISREQLEKCTPPAFYLGTAGSQIQALYKQMDAQTILTPQPKTQLRTLTAPLL